ncbi:DUF4145 domain-containing protein [Cellulomonas fimi]|uniref:DUF4145 domain-containing protein n=1 Tax=Cellulomonas fimi TaxID=1708 RepID=UPI00234D3EAA|nr:DUF4145 domain-containing protein [Cellulomonas fimi]MDC7120264.1 DUF4145 domain-containing protein [Cellulomonas fimi]
MTWDDRWTFRDCGHCGLRDAHMRVLTPEPLRAKPLSQRAAPVRFYVALACPRCGGVTLIEHNDPQAPGRIISITPSPDQDGLDVAHLPEDVARYYGDARRVLDAGVPDAAAVQLRKTLEAAAAHHGATDRVLVKRIEALIEAGLVTRQFGEALTLIRQVGNVGAHASDEHVTQETVERALRFTTLFLRNLFEVPAELAAATAGAGAEEGEADDSTGDSASPTMVI